MNAPRGDDIVYMAWAMDRRWPWQVLEPMDLFPGWRPMNALSWWLAARLDGVNGAGSAALIALMWLVAWGAWSGWAWRRWGAQVGTWTAALLLLTPPFRDLVLWRSWMTSTGALACMGLCLLALETGRRRWAIVAAGLAVGFKETAVLPLGLASWLWYAEARVPAALALLAAPSWLRIALSDPWPGPRGTLENLTRYLLDLARIGWPVVGLVGSLWARARPSPRAVAVVASAAALPLLYPYYNITYLVDGLALACALIAAWAATLLPRQRLSLGVAAGLACLPALGQTALDVHFQMDRRARVEAQWRTLEADPPKAWRLDRETSDDARLLAMWIWFRLHLSPDEARAAEMHRFAPETEGLMVTP